MIKFKKLVTLLGILFCGNLFATAAAEDAPAVSVAPQKTILEILPKEVIEEHIFYHLSARDQLSFAKTCRRANSFLRNAIAFNMEKVQEVQIAEAAIFLQRYAHVSFLKITNIKLNILNGVVRSLGSKFRFVHLKELDLSKPGVIARALLTPGRHGPDPHHLDAGGSLPILIPLMPNLRGFKGHGTFDLYHPGGTPIESIAPHLSCLRVLDLSYNTSLGSSGGLEEIMPHLTNVIDLRVKSINLERREAPRVAPHMTRLINLDLSSNRLSSEGVRALIPYLNSLKYFNVSGNLVDDDGLLELAQGLQQLRFLDISNNLYLYDLCNEEVKGDRIRRILPNTEVIIDKS